MSTFSLGFSTTTIGTSDLCVMTEWTSSSDSSIGMPSMVGSHWVEIELHAILGGSIYLVMYSTSDDTSLYTESLLSLDESVPDSPNKCSGNFSISLGRFSLMTDYKVPMCRTKGSRSNLTRRILGLARSARVNTLYS